MSSSYTTSLTETFTIIHARHIASKVATDLMRFQRFYGFPTTAAIDDYEEELVQLLKHDVVREVTYGFKRNDKWTVATVRYEAHSDGSLSTDDDPGKIRPGHNTEGAYFTSFLSYNDRWWELSPSERQRIREDCPFQRTSGESPQLESGYWSNDLSYSAGGRGLGRSSVREW